MRKSHGKVAIAEPSPMLSQQTSRNVKIARAEALFESSGGQTIGCSTRGCLTLTPGNSMHLRKPEPHIFALGEDVCITSGLLSGLEGVAMREERSSRRDHGAVDPTEPVGGNRGCGI